MNFPSRYYTGSSEETDSFAAGLAFFLSLIERGGPADAADDESLHSLLRDLSILERSTGEAINGFWSHLPRDYAESTLMGHVYRRPYGYAGDFAIIDAIHTRAVSDNPRWRRWDEFLQRQACCDAVRNRAALLPGWIGEVAWERGSTRVLSLGSGPARDLADTLAALPDLDLRCEGVDWEPAAIRHAESVCAAHKGRVRFHCADALRFRPEGSYDLVYSAGLFDYFSDRAFRRCLKHFAEAVAPGGMLVVGNFRQLARAENFMGFGHWKLECREASHLLGLGTEAGFDPACMEIREEPSGNNLFLVIGNQKADR